MPELSLFLSHLKQPEYVHVLFNPLPLYGMALSALFLIYGLIRKDSGVQSAALLMIALVAVFTWIAIEYGEEGYDRVYSMSNADAQLWLKAHAARAGRFEFVFYVTGILAIGAFIAKKKNHPKAGPLVVTALALALLCAGAASWISHAGGQVRHSEFREGPPPGTSPASTP